MTPRPESLPFTSQSGHFCLFMYCTRGGGVEPDEKCIFFSLDLVESFYDKYVHLYRSKVRIACVMDGVSACVCECGVSGHTGAKEIKGIVYTNVYMYFPHMYSLYLPIIFPLSRSPSLPASLFPSYPSSFPVGRTLLNKHS